jgi:ribonuclease VapC
MSPVNFWEVLVRAHATDGSIGVMNAERVMRSFVIQVVPMDLETARIAADAFARFGKRAAGGLNLGDCFAYALAMQRGAPLLFKGIDFTKTDVASA